MSYTDETYGGAPDECSKCWPTKWNHCEHAFNEFVAKASSQIPEGQRAGQWAFNCLHEVRPDLGFRIARGNMQYCDPFFNDDQLPLFFEEVQRLWSQV